MTTALITNDDGIDSAGLWALAEAALAAGLEVVVAAPSWDSSGASASLTGVEEGGRLRTEQRPRVGFDVPAHAVDAAPAMIVTVAMRGAFGPVPDIVLSGINRGRNTGHAVLHSGTVGAALTAIHHGAAGVAVSLDAGAPQHWDTGRHFAEPVIRWASAQRPPAAINLNVPDLPVDAVKGVREAPLAAVGAVQTTITERGAGYLQMTFDPPEDVPRPESDAALLADGWAVITPLEPLAVAREVDLSGVTALAADGAR